MDHMTINGTASRNFAVTGVAGYIAPRHLKSIIDTGNRIVAGCDPHDAVGILDRYSFDVRFFTEIERFDRHLEKLRRGPEAERTHFVSICSPNYLHDAHIRLALRIGADAICEKPLVINPWNLDALKDLELETGRRVYTVLQLRLHPSLIALRDRLRLRPNVVHNVSLTYVTSRGRWYDVSWKGSDERSGGLVTNIGIHLFDLLIWLFGSVVDLQVHMREPTRAAGYIQLQGANVRWLLSRDRADLPAHQHSGPNATFRSITVDDEEIEFTDGFADLHTRVYQEILEGRGFGIDDAKASIDLCYRIRKAPVRLDVSRAHPMVSEPVSA